MWFKLDKNADREALGLLPDIIRDDDMRSVKEQIELRYAHGGGYKPFGEGKVTMKDGWLVILKRM